MLQRPRAFTNEFRVSLAEHPDSPVPTVTTGIPAPFICSIAIPSTADGHHMTDDDFSVPAGWGYFGARRAGMLGTGHALERPFTPGGAVCHG